jgi:protein-tyrosine phosphatase
MTTHPFDALPLADGGKLILTPCPGTKGVELDVALEQLHQAGAQAVISTTPSEELAKLGVSPLPDAVARADMRWFHFPVEDDMAPGPDFEQAWDSYRDAVMSLVSLQQPIAIHCRGGSGRTGLIAALILREMGMDGTQADALVKTVRPNALKLAVHTDYLAARDENHQ